MSAVLILAVLSSFQSDAQVAAETKLSAEAIVAAKFAREHGFSGSRGGALVEAKVLDQGVDAKKRAPFDKIGWISSDGKKLNATDGLTYMVVKNLKPVSIEEVTKPVDGRTSDAAGILTSLILRGETELASKLEAKLNRFKNGTTAMSRSTSVYLAARRVQALRAFVENDYPRAIQFSQKLATDIPAWKEVNKGPALQTSTFASLLNVETLQDLIKDCKRRIAMPSRKSLEDTSLDSMSQAERIRVLIGELDQDVLFTNLKPAKGSRPVNIRLRILREGEAAIDALLDVIQYDKRLSKSVAMDGMSPSGYSPEPVSGIAFQLARQILPEHITQLPGSTLGGTFDVDKFRKLWDGLRKRATEERWMEVLSDDTAGPNKWQTVTGMLVAKRSAFVGKTYVESGLKYESIRSITNPSLNELFTRRVRQCSTPQDGDRSNVRYALRIAYHHYLYDPKAAEPSLRMATDAAMKHARPLDLMTQTREIARCMTALRIWTGTDTDPHFMAYSEWTKKLSLGSSRSNDFMLLFPMTVDPESVLSQSLFTDPKSPWSSPSVLDSSRFGASEVVSSRLLLVPAFRTIVNKMLKDVSSLGSATFQPGVLEVKEDNGGVIQFTLDALPKLQRPEGTTESYRLADKVAYALTGLEGCPEFFLGWPQEKRDKAIGNIESFLKKNEKNIEQLLPIDYSWKRFMAL